MLVRGRSQSRDHSQQDSSERSTVRINVPETFDSLDRLANFNESHSVISKPAVRHVVAEEQKQDSTQHNENSCEARHRGTELIYRHHTKDSRSGALSLSKNKPGNRFG